jgi:hypothetical protein
MRNAEPAARPGRSARRALCAALTSACLSGTPPHVYEPTEPVHLERQRPLAGAQPQLEIGRPLPLLDWLNHFAISLPAKLVLLNPRLQDHRLPDAERRAMERYLDLNHMTSVKVRHNRYAPLDEALRLWRNQEVGSLYRASFGVLEWLRYTLLPDRLFGGTLLLPAGDHYNPFTNTVNVFSSDLAVLLHELGHAKDFQRRAYKGSWALARGLPGVPLLQEANASIDAVRFLGCIGDERGELDAYGTLLPAYGTYVASGSLLLFLPMVIGGHVAGASKRRARSDVLRSQDPAVQEQTARWRSFQPEDCRPPAESEGGAAPTAGAAGQPAAP